MALPANYQTNVPLYQVPAQHEVYDPVLHGGGPSVSGPATNVVEEKPSVTPQYEFKRVSAENIRSIFENERRRYRKRNLFFFREESYPF